jgi:hypothetical protein
MTAAHRPHRVLVAGLLVAALAIGLISMFAVWVNRQTLNPENGTEVSSELLANEEIREAVGAFMVDELFAAVDVRAQLESRLPAETKVFAAPATAALRRLADDRAPELLARPRIQSVWETANLAARKGIVRFLESDNGDAVVLDLNGLVTTLASDLGLNVQIPADVGRFDVVQAKQIETARTATSAVKGLALWGSILTFALFALAVYLAAGWRRIALRRVGWCMIALGLLVVLVRRVIGNRLIDDLVPTESVQPAAHEAWLITTQMLYDIAIALAAYGVVVVAAAWLAGPTKAAVATRRAVAPEMRYRPAMVYAAVGFVYLLVLLWGPTHATRTWWGIITFALLLVLGIEILRRKVADEFPNAVEGETGERIRKRIAAIRHVPGSGNGDAQVARDVPPPTPEPKPG